MNLQDLEALAQGMAPVVTKLIADATSPLLARIAALEARPDPVVERDLDTRIANAVRAATAELPDPPDAEALLLQVSAEVGQLAGAAARAVVATLPIPRDGKNVDPGVVRAMVDDAVAALPPPKDGRDADEAAIAEMVDAAVGKAVAALPPPKDPVGLAGAFKDHEGSLILTLSNGETRNLGRIDGQDGAPGRDGIGPSDFDTEVRDGGRTVLLKFTYGDVTEVHELDLGGLHDGGVYSEDAEFKQGAFVTFGGQAYIAQKATKAKPGESEDWRLAVKKGRDGRSLFDIARARGFTGNETQFVEHVIERALERKPLRFGPQSAPEPGQ